MSERTKEVFIIIDQHTGDMLGSRIFACEDHAIMDIQDRGYRYDPMVNAIMPATITYKTDRDDKP